MQKLAPPVNLQSQIRRLRLDEEIDRAVGIRLVLVQAPAGFGKTTMLAQYHARLTALGMAAGWLGLDSGDNDVGRFAQYLAEALDRADAGIPRPEIDPNVDGIGFAFTLISRVGAGSRPLCLFIDDLDVIQNPTVHDMLKRLLQFMPPGSRVFIGSRRMPDLGIAHLRAQGSIVEIGQTALRFSLDETASLLRDKRSLALDDDDVKKLQHCTEGWITALQLGAMSLKKRHDVKRFLTAFSGSHTDVTDYFAEVVLSGEDEVLREFLVQTSILTPLCASLCDTVTGRTDSRAILARLEKANLFLIPLDSERRWYRYHSLFAGFLRHQLEMRSAEDRETLHRRAAAWYRDNGRPIPAVDHALACGAYDIALPLLEAQAKPLLWEGRVRLLSRWIDALQAGKERQSAEQTIVYAWAFTLARRYQDAGRLLDALDTDADADPQIATVPHGIAALRSFILIMTDRATPDWLEPPEAALSCLDPFTHGLVANSLAYARIGLSDYQGARMVLNHARSTHAELKDNYNTAIFECNESIIDTLQGRSTHAAARLRSLVSRVGSGGRTSAGVALACALYDAGATDDAEKLLTQCLPFISETGTPDSIIASHLTLARIACSRNALADALQQLSDMEYLGHRLALPRMVATVWLERSRIALLRQDFAAARMSLANADDATVWHQYRRFAMYANDLDTIDIGKARLAIRTGEAGIGLAILDQEIAWARSKDRLRRVLKLNILRAEALYGVGRIAEGRQGLKMALQEAATEGQLRMFADEGAAIGKLIVGLGDDALTAAPQSFLDAIVQAAQNGIGPETVREPGADHDGVKGESSGLSVDALTEREIEVLRLLAQGHPNRLLAEKLFVSEATIKTHLRNINAKLNARNRTDAVSIGRVRSII